MNFNDKMSRLEAILNNLENDAVSLDKALEDYEEGIKIVRECTLYLEETRRKITLLNDNADNEGE